MPWDYDALPTSNSAPCGHNATLTAPISADGTPTVGQRYTVPARHGRAVRLRAGQTLRVINTPGSQVCDFWAFRADNPNEFLSMEHVRQVLNRVIPRVGDALVTNRRRPILTMTADTSPGIHDTLIAACDLFRFINLGVEAYHDNCADNLRMALAAIGVTAPEVPQPLNLWMNIPVRDGTLRWEPPVARPGDHVDLRAEVDCIAAMSACPQDMVPINGADCVPRPVDFQVLNDA